MARAGPHPCDVPDRAVLGGAALTTGPEPGAWAPPERVAALLYRDPEGAAADPGDVIEQAREDGRWRELAAPVTAVMHDGGLHALWRWVACTALCAWADEAGYDAVVQTCADPDHAVWSGVAVDRFGRDVTYAELAQAVGDGAELAGERSTTTARLGALRALLSVADRVDLVHGAGEGIVGALCGSDLPALRAELREAVALCESGLGSPVGDVDLAVQLAGLLAPLAELDEPAAVASARRLIQAYPSRDVLVWLRALVVEGSGEETLLLASDLARVAREHDLDVDLQGALDARRRAAGSRPGAT